MAHLGFGDPIKQYPGQVQVTRAVKVQAPGKHFNNLTPTEAKQSYWVVATEHRERYNFEKHLKEVHLHAPHDRGDHEALQELKFGRPSSDASPA